MSFPDVEKKNVCGEKGKEISIKKREKVKERMNHAERRSILSCLKG